MSKIWIDKTAISLQLSSFFEENKSEINEFGTTVNQTFEAFVFAAVVKWYSNNGWTVTFKHPKESNGFVKLKFSTRGRPSNYTYAICKKKKTVIQVRHGLRVATKHHRQHFHQPANIVLDVAVILDTDLSNYKTNAYVDNDKLITFGEAKHLSAFAELIANFIGLVHEMKPDALLPKHENQLLSPLEHPFPFLYVSGHLNPTAQGIIQSIEMRKFSIQVYDHSRSLTFEMDLPTTKPKKNIPIPLEGELVS